MVETGHPGLSIVRQCELLAIARSSFYRTACGESEMNLALMRLIDEQFLECPWYGFVTFSHCRRTLAAVDERNETPVVRRLSFPTRDHPARCLAALSH